MDLQADLSIELGPADGIAPCQSHGTELKGRQHLGVGVFINVAIILKGFARMFKLAQSISVECAHDKDSSLSRPQSLRIYLDEFSPENIE